MAYVTRNEIMEQLIEARNAHSYTVNSNAQLRKEIGELKKEKEDLLKQLESKKNIEIELSERNAHMTRVQDTNARYIKEIDVLKENKEFLEKRVNEMRDSRDRYMKLFNERQDTLTIAKETIKNLVMLGYE